MGKNEAQLLTWSTDGIEAGERLDAFSDLLKESLISVTTSVEDSLRFWCLFSTAKVSHFSVTDISGSTKRSQRQGKNIRQSRSEDYHLVYTGVSWGFIDGAGGESVIPPGALLLIDPRREYGCCLPEGFRNRTLSLPRSWLHGWVPGPDRLVGRDLLPLSSWGSVLGACLHQLSPARLHASSASASAILDQIGGLLSLLYADVTGADDMAPLTHAERHYRRIMDNIHQCHGNLLLSADTVAKDAGISTRTLHRIMAGQGTSFGQALMAQRADAALRMLRSETFDILPVADIARRAGFIDASHFNRVCKRYLGDSPGNIRKKREK